MAPRAGTDRNPEEWCTKVPQRGTWASYKLDCVPSLRFGCTHGSLTSYVRNEFTTWMRFNTPRQKCEERSWASKRSIRHIAPYGTRAPGSFLLNRLTGATLDRFLLAAVDPEISVCWQTSRRGGRAGKAAVTFQGCLTTDTLGNRTKSPEESPSSAGLGNACSVNVFNVAAALLLLVLALAWVYIYPWVGADTYNVAGFLLNLVLRNNPQTCCSTPPERIGFNRLL